MLINTQPCYSMTKNLSFSQDFHHKAINTNNSALKIVRQSNNFKDHTHHLTLLREKEVEEVLQTD